MFSQKFPKAHLQGPELGVSTVAQDGRLELNFTLVKNVSSDMRVRVCNPSTCEVE